jgi:hypothetical protein
MAKKAEWRRHTVEFKRQVVERMKTCQNIQELARELNYHRMGSASFPLCLTLGVLPIIGVYLRSSAADYVFVFYRVEYAKKR